MGRKQTKNKKGQGGIKLTELEIVENAFKRKQEDSAFRSALKKADNPDTAYMCWEYLAGYGVNIQFENRRLPFETVLSAVAKSSITANGCLKLGEAILAAFDNDRENAPARARLRRILACDSIEELCQVLKSVLQFIGSKGIALDYAKLLKELRWFENNPEQTKAMWAQSFFGSITESEENQ